MSTELHFARDNQGYCAYAPQFPTDIYAATLESATVTSVTVPSNYNVWVMYVRVEPSGSAWVSNGSTAAVPAGASLAASSSELICGTIEYKRTVNSGDILSFVTQDETCNIEVAFQAMY